MDEKNIYNLVDKVIYDIGRASDMCWIIFGSQINDEYFSLHLQCPWRIRKGNKILISNLDIYEMISENEDADWDDTKKNIFDEKIEKLLGDEQIRVEKVMYTEVYDLSIHLSHSLVFECFVNDLKYECWRYLKKGEKQHLVITGKGVEE